MQIGTTATAICPGADGGSFTTITIPPSALPVQCDNYLNISDRTRLAYNENGGTSCDDVLFPTPTWIRFIGGSGRLLANCPVPVRRCGATTPGWYSGVYPSSVGATTSGNVCYNWDTNTCKWSTPISVTNCNGFYIFYLSAPPICDARFCTKWHSLSYSSFNHVLFLRYAFIQ